MALCQVELVENDIVVAHESEAGIVRTLRSIDGKMADMLYSFICGSGLALDWAMDGSILLELPKSWLSLMSIEYTPDDSHELLFDDDNLAVTYTA